jgi:hypothetical protein
MMAKTRAKIPFFKNNTGTEGGIKGNFKKRKTNMEME